MPVVVHIMYISKTSCLYSPIYASPSDDGIIDEHRSLRQSEFKLSPEQLIQKTKSFVSKVGVYCFCCQWLRKVKSPCIWYLITGSCIRFKDARGFIRRFSIHLPYRWAPQQGRIHHSLLIIQSCRRISKLKE